MSTTSKVRKPKAIFFFGMKIFPSQRQKIDALAALMQTSRSKAVLSLLDHVDIEKFAHAQAVQSFSAAELLRMPKAKREQIMKRQVNAVLPYFEIEPEQQEIVEF